MRLKQCLQHWPRTQAALLAVYAPFVPMVAACRERAVRAKLDRAVADLEQVYFVQVGANDGVRADPLRPFIVSDARWRGLLLEPVEFLFERLCRNYAEQADRVTCLNVAASDEEGTRRLYFLPEDMGPIDGKRPPAHATGLGSFDRGHVRKHLGPAAENYLTEQEVTCRPLGRICAEAGLPRVDLVCVDTEGHDYRVLAGFDFERYRPAVILFEHRHLSEADGRAIAALLRRYGYTASRHGMNTVAVRKATKERNETGLSEQGI